MKSKKKYAISIVFFIILLVLTFYLLFKNNDIDDVMGHLKNISFEYILIGLALILIYLSVESLYIKLVLKSLNKKITFLQGFIYSCIEFYFSAITPSSTGGQPAQVYYMGKDKISFAKSSVTLLVNTITFKIVILFMGFFAMIFYPDLVFHNSTLFTVIFLFGIIVNLMLIFVCLMLMYSKRWINGIAMFCINLGAKLHLIKNKEEKIEKFASVLQEYQESAKYIKENLHISVKVCIMTFVQRLAMFSVAYVVYKAFGLTGYSYIELVVIQLSVAIAIDSLPLPGGIGASEAMLLLIYKKIFGGTIAVPAMLVTRGLSYYLCLIISGIVVLYNQIRVNFFKNRYIKGDE